jgi:hypothetical protein
LIINNINPTFCFCKPFLCKDFNLEVGDLVVVNLEVGLCLRKNKNLSMLCFACSIPYCCKNRLIQITASFVGQNSSNSPHFHLSNFKVQLRIFLDTIFIGHSLAFSFFLYRSLLRQRTSSWAVLDSRTIISGAVHISQILYNRVA